MAYELTEEQLLIRDEARKLLEKNYSGDALRRCLETEGEYDRNLWQACRDMGWTGIAVPETFGGLGLSPVELGIIAEELGRVCAGVPFLVTSYGVASALLAWGSAEQQSKYLPPLAGGEHIGAVALFDAKGNIRPTLAIEGGKLRGEAVAVIAGLHADVAIVLARRGDEAVLALVELAQPGVDRRALQTFDNSRGAATLTFDGAAAEVLEGGDGGNRAAALLERMAVPLAFEQIGGSDRCLEMARAYALERQAFGQPIGKFQAIKHRIAEMYSLNQIARGNALAATLDLASDGDLTRSASAVRIAAIKAYEFSSKENIQVHGGIGGTWEMDCHLHYRRSRALALELGPVLLWKERLVSHLERQYA